MSFTSFGIKLLHIQLVSANFLVIFFRLLAPCNLPVLKILLSVLAQTVLDDLQIVVTSIITVNAPERILLYLDHATTAGNFNYVRLAVLFHIVFKWHNTDGADSESFVGGVFVVDPVVLSVWGQQTVLRFPCLFLYNWPD